MMSNNSIDERQVIVPAGDAHLEGNLTIPDGAPGIVLFAHGSGSSRHSPRNRFVARALQEAGLGTLLVDLLTAEEEAGDVQTRRHRFDIELLARRLTGVTDWLTAGAQSTGLSVGFFGASTGAGAALVAAAQRPESVGAVVSRGGRPDLADAYLSRVTAPTLLIVGGNDGSVIPLNQGALARLHSVKEMIIVPGASHLFEEPGTLEEVARLAADWFRLHLGGHNRSTVV